MTENMNTPFNMPVVPAYGMNGGNGGLFGENGSWLIIILLIFMGVLGNGWGNNAASGYGIQQGFDQQNVMNGITGIQTTLANGFAQVESSANARQMADMQQDFAMQSAFQNCCCENRLASANLLNAINQDGAATRTAIAQGDQEIKDKLCQMELDGIKQNYENRIAWMQQDYNNRFAAMQNQIDALRDANAIARSTAQFNALGDRFQASQDLQTNALEQYLAPVARPAYIVQNPNCCQGMGYGNCPCSSFAS